MSMVLAAQDEYVLRNARIVVEDRVINGSLSIRNGTIQDVSEGRSAVGDDVSGDFIIPGLIELHTDQIEAHFKPRPGVKWPAAFAVQAHDAQIAGSGITTVFDALCVGMDEDRLAYQDLKNLIEVTQAAEADGLLRASHFTHLRCEVVSDNILEAFEVFRTDPSVRLASLMDHTPGQRQFVNLDKHREFYQQRYSLSDSRYEALLQEKQEQSLDRAVRNRAEIVAYCRANSIILASHDDGTLEHVEEAKADGVKIAEFPTTTEAAAASHAAGLSVLMGAPNLVRGLSHSGNVSARDLAVNGNLDILSSDYVPLSLLQAAFLLPTLDLNFSLPEAIALVTRNPAEAVGLPDRGTIAAGLRADLVRVHDAAHGPVVRTVWREGVRVI